MLLNSIWTQPPVLAAVVTGTIALILALWNFFSARKTQTEIEILKSELAEKKSDNDARREYEFEARKRLYQEYEPLLFQLMEASENALHRIQSLARTARHGDLNDIGWLSQFNYYTKSTLYKLLVPIAIYQIMQKKLTLLDITVDNSIGLRYKIVKQIYLSYTDDFEFARLIENIYYEPNNIDWQVKREDNPKSFWRQGLPMGLLDKTIDILIEKDEHGKERVISYGEFEKKLGDIGNNKNADIHLSRDIFYKFHPESRPILWRILIAQSFLLKALLALQNLKPESITQDVIRKLLVHYDDESLNVFRWSNDKSFSDQIEEPFRVAVKYFENRF